MSSNQSFNGTELVSYNAGSMVIDNCCIPCPNYYPIYEQHYHHWYPSVSYFPEKSKIEQGFKVVGKLIENKVITKELTIKEFIKLVNDIAEII